MAKAKAKPVKKAIKKSAPKKAAPAKKSSAVKAKKPAPKKAAPVKKSAPKKGVPIKKPVKKPVAKASASKKPAAKKSIVKKTSPKNNLSKKTAANAAPKKAVQKKSAVKKPLASKSAPKKAPAKPAAVKKAQPKKPVAKSPAKKASAQAPSVKKTAASKIDIKEIISKKLGSKVSSKKPAAEVEDVEPEGRSSAAIHFTMDDIMDFLSGKSKGDDRSASSAGDKKLLKKQAKVATKASSAPKKPMSAASIADILGFNPMAESRAHFEEKDVPKKWKKYYRLLMDVKKRFAEVADDMTDVVAPAKDELTHEQAVQGMDAADIGSKNFERDMAYSLLSTEQAILQEVDAAIERMREGTYGICEITGKPIPESRLLAIPWACCTIEGQRMKEAAQKRQKANLSRNAFGEIGEDMDDLEVYDENDE